MTTDPFLEQLAALCRSERTRAKWVIVPAHSLGHTLGERLALEAGSWVNVRFTTPFDLAIDAAAPFLVERGVNPIGDDLGPSLMMRLLRDLPPDVPGYFRHLAEHPTLGAALWSSVLELRLAGVSATDLRADAFENPAKHAELHALLLAYEAWLVTERRADAALIYTEAIRRLVACRVRPADLVLELPDTLWSPIVRALLDALPGTKIVPHVPLIPGLPLPRRLEGAARSEQPIAAPLARLMQPEAFDARTPDIDVTLFHAGGPEAEVEEVFRRILHAPDGPLKLDEVEIACASSDYPELVWQKARRYNWPITLASGLAGTAARPVRALLAWCDWIAGGFMAADLRRMLASGDLKVEIPGGPGSGQAASLLLRAAPTWGRQTYALALTAFAAAEREQAGDPEADEDSRTRRLRRAAQADALLGWIESLLEPLPDTGAAVVPVQALVSAAADFAGRVTAIENELDGQAAGAVKDALQELTLLGDVACPTSVALNLVRAALGGIRVASSRARPGHLHVSMLPRAGYAGRRHTFVIGLQEGQVFPSPFEDPVLLDVERDRIHKSLAVSNDRIAEAVHSVVARLAVLPGAGSTHGPAICMSCSCRDLRDARQTFPSWLMLQAFRLMQRDPDLTYQHLDEALGEPASQVPANPAASIGDSGWWLANLRAGAQNGVERVFAAFPDLAQGDHAEAERDSDRFTEYDGLVRSAGPVLDPRQSGLAVSPTRLEKLAGCPFAYFLERGLGLEPIEEDERDQDAWLDGATRGSLLHELYAAMMRELRRRQQTADPARDIGWLTARADLALADLRASMPPPSDDVFKRERDGIMRDLGLFLSIEQKTAESGVKPVAFEVDFGGRGEAGDEPLGQPHPVVVKLAGSHFLLGGRIDRIDQLEDGTYEVLDYKTGSCYRPAYRKVFRNGRLLQHALYGLAAEKLLRSGPNPKAKVVAGCYSFPTIKGGPHLLRIARPAAAQVTGVLTELLDLVANGAFTASAREKTGEDCTFCKFTPLCGGEIAVSRAATKLENEKNTPLAPYRRLQGDDYE